MKSYNLLSLFLLSFYSYSQPLFTARTAKETGINFENTLTETERFNYFHFDYFYNGGGVAIGDINNDGLQDVFFSGNQVQNKLFLNQGNLNFEDISKTSGIEQGTKLWDTGVSMIDINADGWLDIYVCRSGSADEKRPMTNLLYINQHDNTFKEQGEEFGLADGNRSVQAAFLDFDRDGDLDVFVINHIKNNSYLSNDKRADFTSNTLYRNDNGKFFDITDKAEVGEYGFGMGVGISDLNNDGWPDIYVANDFMLSDFLYINQKDGTFKNEVRQRTGHISLFSMGVDIADVNNDLLPDIYVADMAAEDHVRSKQNMGSMDVEAFWNNIKFGEHYQFMFNCLQLNSSIGVFREIAQLAGVAKTDWSWAPLIADFDNDGWKDIFVSNGIYRDVRNNDYIKEFKQKYEQGSEPFYALDALTKIPQSKVNNYIFKNNGDLTFSKKMEEWGFDFPINSNGAAYADLDNDGDLDIILNNSNEEALVMENQSRETYYLTVAVEESEQNRFGIGAKIHVLTTSGEQIQEVYTTRGFQSSVPPMCYFGIPDHDSILQVNVIWNDQTISDFTNIPINKKIILSKGLKTISPIEKSVKPLLTELEVEQFNHKETNYNDFEKEVLLPHKMSQLGPFIGKGDVNTDGLEDFYVVGAAGQSGALYLQTVNGFEITTNQPWESNSSSEELNSTFFDVDNDGDLDLYVVSGSNEGEQINDHLYVNDGQGNFENATERLKLASESNYLAITSGQVVVPFDYDKDGWMDLIVPGRQVAGEYPKTPKSIIFQNEKGTLIDVTQDVAPEFEFIGMVTDVLVYDYDNDGDEDFIAVGEWMGISFFNNRKGKFTLDTTQIGNASTVGWWNTIYPFDFDQDGEMELLLGNIGGNNKYHPSQENPLHVYHEDFDGNGTTDIVLAKHQKDAFYPVRGRECSSQQMPIITDNFPTYSQYSSAELTDIYSIEKLDGALHFEAREFRSGYLKKVGAKWQFIPFSNALQIGSINAFVEMDVTGDGKNELILAGNKYEAEVETARYDANFGDVLRFGKGDYQIMDPSETGLLLNKNVKDVQVIGDFIIVGCNDDPLKIYKANHK
jgi:hypothetical protein